MVLPHVLSVQVSSQDEAVRGLEAILQGERTKVRAVGEGSSLLHVGCASIPAPPGVWVCGCLQEALGQQSREEQDAEINKLHSRLRETERSRSLLTQQLRVAQSQLVSARSEGDRVGG